MSESRKFAAIFFAVIAPLVLTPTVGHSQNVYGTIVGTVSDSSGAVIADVNVTLTNLATGESHTSALLTE